MITGSRRTKVFRMKRLNVHRETEEINLEGNYSEVFSILCKFLHYKI